jgi:hypothetical protein
MRRLLSISARNPVFLVGGLSYRPRVIMPGRQGTLKLVKPEQKTLQYVLLDLCLGYVFQLVAWAQLEDWS